VPIQIHSSPSLPITVEAEHLNLYMRNLSLSPKFYHQLFQQEESRRELLAEWRRRVGKKK
ncbi:hypothetical protein GBF38_012175, partial [Nibea albiflora]